MRCPWLKTGWHQDAAAQRSSPRGARGRSYRTGSATFCFGAGSVSSNWARGRDGLNDCDLDGRLLYVRRGSIRESRFAASTGRAASWLPPFTPSLARPCPFETRP